jgi:hypothetical protein
MIDLTNQVELFQTMSITDLTRRGKRALYRLFVIYFTYWLAHWQRDAYSLIEQFEQSWVMSIHPAIFLWQQGRDPAHNFICITLQSLAAVAAV